MNSKTLLLEGSLVRRPRPRIRSGSLVRWLAVLTFCYLLSGQAFGKRDPVGTSLGWDIYAELAFFLVSVMIAWAVWAKHGVLPRPTHSLIAQPTEPPYADPHVRWCDRDSGQPLTYVYFIKTWLPKTGVLRARR
jgi:hypothetical protein